MVRGRQDVAVKPVRLVAKEPRGGLTQRLPGLRQVHLPVHGGGERGEPRGFELPNDAAYVAVASDGDVEERSRRRPHHFWGLRVNRVAGENYRIRAKCVRDADDGAGVARIVRLHAHRH